METIRRNSHLDSLNKTSRLRAKHNSNHNRIIIISSISMPKTNKDTFTRMKNIPSNQKPKFNKTITKDANNQTQKWLCYQMKILLLGRASTIMISRCLKVTCFLKTTAKITSIAYSKLNNLECTKLPQQRIRNNQSQRKDLNNQDKTTLNKDNHILSIKQHIFITKQLPKTTINMLLLLLIRMSPLGLSTTKCMTPMGSLKMAQEMLDLTLKKQKVRSNRSKIN